MVRKLEFYEESASQWYDRLNAKDKANHQSLMNSLINAPHQFLDIYSKREYEARANHLAKIQAVIPAEELYTLDNYIARTFYDACPTLEMLAPVTTVKTSKSHESKTYAGTDYGTAKLVGAHGSFSDPPMIGMGVSPTYIKGIGVHAGYELSFSEIDEAGLYDIEWYFALKCGEKVGTLHDQKLCLGEAAKDAEVNTTLVKGIFNYASGQACMFGGGADNIITTTGDLYSGLIKALGFMDSVKEPGDNIFISTPGFYAETLILKDALGISDYDNIYKTFFATGLIKEWWILRNIDATATPTVTTQECMLLKRGMNTLKREIVYPLQSKMMAKEFPDDVKAMIMIMDIIKFYNGAAAVIPGAGAGTTSTVGFGNGRVI